MNIKETFLRFTDRTYPHGTERELFHMMPKGFQKDEWGNLFYKIGNSDVMFTSHLDTATSALTAVNHVIEGDIIKTDGKSILGADDKAGVTIMLYMIDKKIPGLYYFFLGEEVGCVGSKALSKSHSTNPLSYINKVISFDRRGLDSVITFQASSRCCSDEFGNALSKALNEADVTFNYKIDPTGVYTDSAQFTSIYPECTNISVGYYSEHTSFERQDINHLEKLAKACCLIDWSSLPVKRDPKEVEYRSYGYSNYSGYGGYSSWEWEDYEYYPSRSSDVQKRVNEITYFWDHEFNYLSSFEVDSWGGKISKIDLDPERVQMEEDMIQRFLEDIELEYDTMKWDGERLKINYTNGGQSETKWTERHELLEFMDEDFDLIKLAKKCEEEESRQRSIDKMIDRFNSSPDYTGIDL
jgi:hypothetical protein